MNKYIVGIDAHMIGDRSGGNESYYRNILLNMEFSNDWEAILFVMPGADIHEYRSKFKIVEFQSKSPFVRNFIELPALCLKYKLDILHTQYFIPFVRFCPVVCSIHDICFEHYKDIFTKKAYFRQKVLIPYAARHSKAIFTISQSSRQDIAQTYKIPDEKIIMAYCAVNNNFCVLRDQELSDIESRAKFGIGSEPFLLSVGNLQPRKNLPRLIRAFNKYRNQEHHDSKLVIVGKKAWMFDGILSEAMSDTDSIILTDYVTNQDLVRLYNAARAFIYPSFFEGFGIPPLEALACGTPVAVANATSLPEVVGKAGIYFDPFSEDEIEEAIRLIMHDENVREKCLQNAQEQVNKFSWRKSAERIAHTYAALLKNSKKSTSK